MSASRAADSEPAPNIPAEATPDMSRTGRRAHAESAPRAGAGATRGPRGSAIRTSPIRRTRPVKAGRAILLLAGGGGLVAYLEFPASQRRREAQDQWTQERAIPTVAVVAPKRGGETRELVLPGNVDAYYSGPFTPR